MLVELSVMEQRYQAVLAVVQEGWKIVEVARRMGVARQTVHRWIERYEREGLASLADHSHRPQSCPHQVPPELEALICEIRRQHPGWGPRRIEHELGRRNVDPVPSVSSIYRCLKRHSLIELRRRRRRRDEYRRWERERPMQLWQMDVMGGVMLDDGTELKVVTGVDDHSRFCVAAGLVRRAISKSVCEVLAASLRRYGIPDEILTDNGKVFTGRFGPRPVEVMFDRICRENGISHRHTAVRSPTTTGKIEWFHQTVRKEFLADRTFRSMRSAQRALDRWVHEYNTTRPHQALEMATPAQRFRLEPVSKEPISVPVDSAEEHRGQWVLRRVASNGILSVDNQIISAGNGFKGQLVDVFVDDSVIQIWHQNHLVKTAARVRKGPVRKVRADGLHVKDQPNTKRHHQVNLDRVHGAEDSKSSSVLEKTFDPCMSSRMPVIYSQMDHDLPTRSRSRRGLTRQVPGCPSCREATGVSNWKTLHLGTTTRFSMRAHCWASWETSFHRRRPRNENQLAHHLSPVRPQCRIGQLDRTSSPKIS